MNGDLVRALEPLVDAFEALGVVYRVGGSVATSVYGTPRATLDVDVVCNLGRDAVASLVAALETAYDIDADMILEAIRHRSSAPSPAISFDEFVFRQPLRPSTTPPVRPPRREPRGDAEAAPHSGEATQLDAPQKRLFPECFRELPKLKVAGSSPVSRLT